MGMFPYTCKICHGAYQRCGKQKEHAEKDYDSKKVKWCQGGQFCWEDEIILEIEGTDGGTYYLPGIYEGYGYVEFVNSPVGDIRATQEVYPNQGVIYKDKPINIYCLEFKEFFKNWHGVRFVAKNFICRSCFNISNEHQIIELNDLMDIEDILPEYSDKEPL